MNQGSRGGRRLPHDEDGIGLLEVIIAMTVLLAAVIGIGALATNLVGQVGQSNDRQSAAEIAEQGLEQLNSESPNTLRSQVNQTLPLVLSPAPKLVNGAAYTVTSYVDWSPTGSATNPCAGGSTPQVLRATVTVSWQGNSYAETSVIYPSYGLLLDANGNPDGYLSIQITGADGTSAPTNVTSVTVNVTPYPSGTTSTYTPDASGCVVVPEAGGATVGTAADYTVSLSGPSGWVDGFQENTAPTSQLAFPSGVPVYAGAPTLVSFSYDDGGNVAVSYSAPAATGMPVSVSNSKLTPSGWQTVLAANPSTGVNPTVGPLFPYRSGYTIWAGDCAAEQPAANTGTTMSVTPAATTPVTVSGGLGTLVINASKAGVPFVGATAVATVDDPNMLTDGCAPATNSTTIASASNNKTLPQATISVASTSGFTQTGTILLVLTTKTGTTTIVKCTGTPTATTFTSCSGGSGTLATGGSVVNHTETFGLQPTAGTGVGQSSTSILPQTYDVTVTDPGNGQTVRSTGVVVTAGNTTTIAVTVP